MTSALLHFENGVPIDDCDVRSENKDRLARVDHVFWQWKRNPFLDTMARSSKEPHASLLRSESR
jgi:hypothetical protein